MERTIKIHKINILIILILFVFLTLIGCSSEESVNNNQLEKIVNPTLITSIAEISIPKFKLGKNYKVEDLPEAIAVSRAIFNKKDTNKILRAKS